MSYRLSTDPTEPRAVALSKVSALTMINLPDEIEWVRTVHVHDLPLDVKCVVLVGREDWPEGFLCYTSPDPLMSDVPIVYVEELARGEPS